MQRLFLFFCLIALSLTAQLPLSFASGGGGGTPYFEITTPFVVNITDKDGGSAFLQVNTQLKVKNEELKEYLHAHLPALQHTIMLVLSEQTVSGIRTVQGKQRLRAITLKEIQDFFMQQVGDPIVEEIYFTGFIIQ